MFKRSRIMAALLAMLMVATFMPVMTQDAYAGTYDVDYTEFISGLKDGKIEQGSTITLDVENAIKSSDKMMQSFLENGTVEVMLRTYSPSDMIPFDYNSSTGIATLNVSADKAYAGAFVNVVIVIGGTSGDLFYSPQIDVVEKPASDESEVIEIYTKQELAHLTNSSGHYVLMNDIEFTEADFSKGGDFYNDGQGWKTQFVRDSYPFKGVFDGNNHVIKGLKMRVSSEETNTLYIAGLIGYNRGTIKNLGLVDLDIEVTKKKYDSFVGGIAAVSDDIDSVIENCYVSGSITYNEWGQTDTTGNVKMGSIAGFASGIITRCSNYASINLNLKSIYNTSGERHVGGIVGENTGTISKCFNGESVTVTYYSKDNSPSIAGGISAYCHSGMNDSTAELIVDCFNIADISGTTSSTGGIVGFCKLGVLRNCYSIGRCYQKDKVPTKPIIGTNSGDLAHSGLYYPVDYEYVTTNTCAEALSFDEMMSSNSFAGYDFSSVWEIDISTGYRLPILKNTAFAFNSIDFNLDKDDHILEEGGSVQLLTIGIDHSQPLIWRSNDSSIASVSNTGVVTGNSAGETFISVVSPFSSKEETCHVRVDHIFGEWHTTTEPACEAPGIQARKCEYCGKEEFESIEPVGHQYGEWVTTKDPTVDEEGVKEHTCTICHQVESEIIPKIPALPLAEEAIQNAEAAKETAENAARNAEVAQKAADEAAKTPGDAAIAAAEAAKTAAEAAKEAADAYKEAAEKADQLADKAIAQAGTDEEKAAANTAKEKSEALVKGAGTAVSNADTAVQTAIAAITSAENAKATADAAARAEAARLAEIAYNNGNIDYSLPKVSIKAPKKAKKAFTPKWKKLSKKNQKKITKIEYEYSMDPNFASGNKFRTASKKSTGGKKIKVGSKKIYYVRSHTYVYRNGVKYVSPWSKTKKVKTK